MTGERVLIFFPTLRTRVELDFWRRFVSALRERGYGPIVVSFLREERSANLRENHHLDCPRIFIPSSLDLLPDIPDFSRISPRLPDELAPALALLVESVLPPGLNGVGRERLIEGARFHLGYLLHLCARLKPCRVIINNDTLPLHYAARAVAEYLGIPAVHSERSPTGTQWFEADGFYARSGVAAFLGGANWNAAGAHELHGAEIVNALRSEPMAHRSMENGAPEPRAPQRRRGSQAAGRRFFLPMDHVQATGWTQRSHPARHSNYPLFNSPADAIARLAVAARAAGGTLVVKPHPADQHVRSLRLPDHVELFEGDLSQGLNDADVVLCFLTKVAFVSLAWQKPVVTLAPNVAALSGVTFHCGSVDEIDARIAQALEHEPSEASRLRVRRFLGYLDRHYFVGNDLANPGAALMLDRHFPPVGEDVDHPGQSPSSDAAFLRGIDLMAPDEPTPTGSDVFHGPFSRARGRRIEEIEIVAELFERGLVTLDAGDPVMVDVGACTGSSFRSFVQNGWRVHAFEPNPPLFSKLQAACGGRDQVVLNPWAVSNKTGDRVPFYTSEESIGISSMTPFRESHRPAAIVETIRLDDYCRRNGVRTIDFLKIDVEGFDLMVLQGLDWNVIRPRVIVCEFEDAKTAGLGYCFADLARFLAERDYTLYISEWHPITRYGGGEHRWRAMHRWPTQLLDRQAWGNVIAFREPPDESAVHLITRQAVDFPLVAQALKTRPEGPLARTWRRRFATYLDARHPHAARCGRTLLRGLRALRHGLANLEKPERRDV